MVSLQCSKRPCLTFFTASGLRERPCALVLEIEKHLSSLPSCGPWHLVGDVELMTVAASSPEAAKAALNEVGCSPTKSDSLWRALFSAVFELQMDKRIQFCPWGCCMELV